MNNIITSNHELLPLKGIDIMYKMTEKVLMRGELLGLDTHEITEKLAPLKEAYELVKRKLRENKEYRRDGKRYFEHIRDTAEISLLELPEPTIRRQILAILHDIFEDGFLKIETIQDLFGDDIAQGVLLLSKKDYVYYMQDDEKAYVAKLSEEEYASYVQKHKTRLRKLRNDGYYTELFASNDTDVIWVKIADRIDNIRDLIGSGTIENIIRYIQETETYIITGLEQFGDPYRIGISHLKSQLANMRHFVSSYKTKKELAESLV